MEYSVLNKDFIRGGFFIIRDKYFLMIAVFFVILKSIDFTPS